MPAFRAKVAVIVTVGRHYFFANGKAKTKLDVARSMFPPQTVENVCYYFQYERHLGDELEHLIILSLWFPVHSNQPK